MYHSRQITVTFKNRENTASFRVAPKQAYAFYDAWVAWVQQSANQEKELCFATHWVEKTSDPNTGYGFDLSQISAVFIEG